MFTNMKFLILILVVVSGCSTFNSNNIAPGYVEAIRSLNNYFFPAVNEQLTPRLINDIPYASSLLSIGRGPKGLIILESTNNKKEVWVSADDIYLVIQNGRIIETKGLSNNITNFTSSSSNQKEFSGFKYYYSYDFPLLLDLEVISSRRVAKIEKVRLFNSEKELTLIEENIRNDYLGWKATNKFWVDSDNYVWKSEQNISPKLPTFYLEVTKKPAK